MTNEKILNYIRTLREKSEADKLIAFVGAGVSRNVSGMPSWYELIVKMANAANYSKCETCAHKKPKCKNTCNFKEEYTPDEFLKIPQYVANKNKHTYLDLIKSSFPVLQVNSPLSKAIFEIHPAHIITTNYDNLLETSSNFFRSQYDLIIKDVDLLNSNKNKYIIKMHGDLNDLNSIVLKESDYLNYSQNHILIETFIKALLTDHTLLFLGYSLSDYNIKLIISWINYMRTQNNAIRKNGIGYLVLHKKISKSEEKYFKNNGIEIIYINDIPLIDNIPSELNLDAGKKLYSFLKVIAEPNLETAFDYKLLFKDAVHFACQFKFVDLRNLMKLLYIKGYVKQAGQLKLYNEKDYNHLYEFLNDGCTESIKLQQLFINAGIGIIFHQKLEQDKTYTILEFKFYENIISDLYKNELFCLYLQNRYIEIAETIQTEKATLEDSCFYMSIVNDFDKSISENFSKINYDELTIDRKVAYLLNASTIRYLTNFEFSNKDLEIYINNCNSKAKNIFSNYQNLLHGNHDKKSSMLKSLDKLKELYRPTTSTMGVTLNDLYEIQNYALNQYYFYFFNCLIFRRFTDLPNFLLPYIEAILCTNGEHSSVDNSFFASINYEKQKYELSKIDFDIITKFCDIKKLKNLLNEYNVEKINCSQSTKKFVIQAFKNIADSILELNLYGIDSPTLTTLINYAQLLLHLQLNQRDKTKIHQTLITLFSNLKFARYLFSRIFPANRISVSVLSQLINQTTSTNQFSIVKIFSKMKRY